MYAGVGLADVVMILAAALSKRPWSSNWFCFIREDVTCKDPRVS